MTRIYRFEVVRKALNVASLPDRIVRSSMDVAAVVRAAIGNIDHEVFVVLHLDAKNRIRGVHEAGRGSRTACFVDPVEVFRAAVIAGATSIVLAHNHPSGDPTPSSEDLAITRKLDEGARFLGIRVLDHVVIGEDGHHSMLDSKTFRFWQAA